MLSQIKLLPIIIIAFFSVSLLTGEDTTIDFARKILPILSDKCFACHGPDTKKKDLVRLDLEELAKKDLGGYHAIDPNDLNESEPLFRIADEDDPMKHVVFEPRYVAPKQNIKFRVGKPRRSWIKETMREAWENLFETQTVGKLQLWT